MHLQIRANGLELDDELRSRVERRVRFAVGRFGGQAKRVVLQLTEPARPEPTCRVVVHGAWPEPLVVEVRGASVAEAVGFAVDRAVRALERGLELRDEVGLDWTKAGADR